MGPETQSQADDEVDRQPSSSNENVTNVISLPVESLQTNLPHRCAAAAAERAPSLCVSQL